MKMPQFQTQTLSLKIRRKIASFGRILFGAFFSVFCRKVCRKLYGNFLYVSSFFVRIFMGLYAGMGRAGSRSNPGVNVAIPIGIALRIIVSAARNQRKAKLAPKLENAVSDVIGGVGGE